MKKYKPGKANRLKTGPQIGDTDCVIYAQKWSTFYTEPIKDKIKIILFQFVDIRFHYLVNNIVFLFCLSFIP